MFSSKKPAYQIFVRNHTGIFFTENPVPVFCYQIIKEISDLFRYIFKCVKKFPVASHIVKQNDPGSRIFGSIYHLLSGQMN